MPRVDSSINRRQFIASLASFSAVVAAPVGIAASTETLQDLTTLNLPEDIVALESCIANHPGQFSWMVHNELRHRYLPINEWMSRKHADIILSRSPMDEYILNTLSDWHFTNNHGQLNPERGASLLLNNVQRYPNFSHLRAACLLKSGDTCRQLGLHLEANQLYSAVAQGTGDDFGNVYSLRIYNTLAQHRLDY